ncbi:MAG: chemotaxis protein CheB, partial [Nitrospirota bacterium]|nr:chemotaxis protein CheB [Nitrospirota bacterium]
FALSVEAPLHHARPSIDITFESMADYYGRRAIGVILTGTGQDGAQGMAALRQRGGQTVVQTPASAEAPGMPEAAISAGAAGHVLPPEEIGPFLVKLTEERP